MQDEINDIASILVSIKASLDQPTILIQRSWRGYLVRRSLKVISERRVPQCRSFRSLMVFLVQASCAQSRGMSVRSTEGSNSWFLQGKRHTRGNCEAEDGSLPSPDSSFDSLARFEFNGRRSSTKSLSIMAGSRMKENVRRCKRKVD